MANGIPLNDPRLRDPINNISDGFKDPVQAKVPGFFESLRNPIDLILEESLPASLYQWMTGNTKKKQAEEALNFIRRNPNLRGSKIYEEAERKLNRFGYLLDDGPQTFDFKEFTNMAKSNPKLFGAELINMLMADPYLLFMPLGWHRFGRGVVNSIRLKYSKKFKVVKDNEQLSNIGNLKRQAAEDIKVGAIASLAVPLVFSTTWQLGEKAEIDPKRTAIETTIGATAGAVLSTTFAGVSALTSKLTFAPQPVVNKIINETFDEYQNNPTKLLEFNNEGRYVFTDHILNKLKKETDFLDNEAHFQDTANKIYMAMKPPVENSRDMAKNTLLKAATFGGVGATAEFLTEKDEKLIGAAEGFLAGSGLYLGYKGLSFLLRNTNKQWDIAEKKVEAAMSTPDKMSIVYLTEAQKLSNAWKDMVPDITSRQRVFHYIAGTKVDENLKFSRTARPIQWNELSKTEKKYYNIVTKTFDELGDSFGPEGAQLIYGKRSSYIPLLWDDYPGRDVIKFVEEFDTRVYGGSGKFPFTKRSVFQDINKGLEKGYKLKAGMDDPVELIRTYTFAASKAITQRNLVRYLKREGIGRQPYLINTPEQLIKLNPKDRSNYVKFDKPHPAFVNQKDFDPLIHKAVKGAVNMVFDARSENDMIAALNTTNFMMKRLAVGFSFFHAGALAESLWFAGGKFDTLKKVLRPTSKEEVKNFFLKPNQYLQKDFPYALRILREGGFDDVIRFARGHGLEVSIPEDAGNDIFYYNIKKLDNLWKHQFGIKTTKDIENVFRTFDRITWDQIFTRSKLFAFLTSLEKDYLYKLGPNGKWGSIKNPNKILPGDDQFTIYRKARGAAAYVNDAFGGQNWQNLVSEIENPFFKKAAQTMLKPGSRGYMQQFLFAPDWTISNFRIISKSMPGFEADPNKRRLYQYYALKAALTFAVAGNLLNYMFSGHSILENTDPTRIDLGNGEVLTFSKQLMEPLHWITDPQSTYIKKIGSLPRTSIEVLTNKQYLTTKWSPNITKKDDAAIEKALAIGGHVGMRFLPIWLQSTTREISEALQNDGLSLDVASDTAMDFVLGQLGHPRYQGPRYTQYKTKGLVRSPYETLF